MEHAVITHKHHFQEKALKNSLKELDPYHIERRDIHFDRNRQDTLLGRGGFCEVYRGTLRGKTITTSTLDAPMVTVAVKCLKVQRSDLRVACVSLLLDVFRSEHGTN